MQVRIKDKNMVRALKLFSVDHELSVPASVELLLGCSASLGKYDIIARQKRKPSLKTK